MGEIIAETTAILDMMGAGCVSCAYAIEKTGRKIPGVTDIHVDIARSKIRVQFDERETGIPDRIIEIVNRIGHDAVRVVDSDCAGSCPSCRCKEQQEGGM